MKSSSPIANLLVDGYNVIGTWAALKQLRDEHGYETARDQLVATLINYSALQGFKTRVVFDAYAETSPERSEPVSDELAVHYTAFGQTADSYIEKFCAQFRKQSWTIDGRLIVATSDHAQKLTVLGYGAEWMSAQKLESEVKLSMRHLQQRTSRKKPQRHYLMHAIDPKARDRLSRMRFGQP